MRWMKLRRSLAGVLACAMLLPGSAGMLTLDADAAEQEIQVQQEDQRRKTYALTPAGRQALRQEYERLRRMVADGEQAEVEML